MTSHLTLARIIRTLSLGVAISLVAVAGQRVAAADTAEGAYTWSAELVAFDEAAKTATVQARIVSHAEIKDFSRFSKGDQIMLTWSGAYSNASGVRNLTHGTSVDEGELFTMPVEFISMEMDNRYVNFKVPVPGGDVAKIKSLTPGTWVTVTSPHEPGDQAEAVSGIRPYNS